MRAAARWRLAISKLFAVFRLQAGLVELRQRCWQRFLQPRFLFAAAVSVMKLQMPAQVGDFLHRRFEVLKLERFCHMGRSA